MLLFYLFLSLFGCGDQEAWALKLFFEYAFVASKNFCVCLVNCDDDLALVLRA